MNLLPPSPFNVIDFMIREGRPNEARATLKATLETNPIPLTRLQRATFFRRLGDYTEALVQLRPEVYLSNELKPSAKPDCVLEYATNLVQLGLTREAQRLLQSPVPRTFAWHQLKGFLALKELDYPAAVEQFQAAHQSPDATTYQRLVSQVNIANSLLGTFEFKKALAQSQSTLDQLIPQEHAFLIRYLHHIRSQAFAFSNQPADYHKCQEQVFRNSRGDPSLIADEFEFCRGRFVSECVLQLPHAMPLKPLLRAAEHFHLYHAATELQFMNQPSSVQAVDRSGVFLQKRMEHLGISHSQTQRPLGETVVTLGPPRNVKTKNWSHVTGDEHLKPGQIPHRLLGLFLANPFKKMSAQELFEELFPEKRGYHPSSSPNLVHQAVKRTNRCFQQSKLPLKIESTRDRYHLTARSRIKIHFAPKVLPDQAHPAALMHHFGLRWFQSKELAQTFKLTQRQAQNIIKRHAQFLITRRESRNLNYQFKFTTPTPQNTSGSNRGPL